VRPAEDPRVTAFIRGLLARRLVREVALSYVFSGAVLVVNLVTGIIIVRLLGVDGRGEVAAILALTQVATWVFGMGCTQAASFHLARHPDQGGVLLGSWLLLLIPLAVLGVAISVALLPIALAAQREEVVLMAQLFAITIVLALVLDLLTGVILGDHRFVLWNWLRFAQPAGVAVLYVLLWRLDALTVSTALIANATVFVLLVCGAGLWVLRRYGRPRADAHLARSTFWYGFRVHGSSLAGTVNARLDLAIIPAFLGATSVGLYSVATNVAGIAGTLAGTVAALVLPAAARRAERAASTVVASMYAALGVGALGAVLIALLAEDVLRLLYGDEAVAAAQPLRVLLVGSVLLAPGLVLSQGLNAANRPLTGALPQIAGSVLTVVGLMLFLRDGGIMAAAWVTTSAYGVVLAMALVLYRGVAGLPWRALSPAQSLAALGSGPSSRPPPQLSSCQPSNPVSAEPGPAHRQACEDLGRMSGASVTVVVPTRNRRSLLELTLRSVLGQTGVELRVVVVDEGSSDDTPDFLSSLSDPRVSVLRHDEPKGPSAARNAGLAAAQTEWVAFVDDDDLWAPDKLAAQLAALRAQPSCQWSCVSAVHVDEHLRPWGVERLSTGNGVLRRLLATDVIPAGASTVLVRTALLRELEGFRTDLHPAEDWECWIRLAQRSTPAVVDRPLIAYRVWRQSASHDVPLMQAAQRRVREIHATLGAQLGVPVGQDDLYLARLAMQNGRRAEAARRLGRLAARRRSPRYVALALGALIAPETSVAIGARRWHRSTEPGWMEAVEAWLLPYRTGSSA
jgi:O-antigen/teichoic acid export membrane protein